MGEVEEKVVEIICKAENALVGIMKTPGPLDARTIQLNLRVVDQRRCPVARLVQDGENMQCQRCSEVLYFRTGQGELFVAMPGTLRVEA